MRGAERKEKEKRVQKTRTSGKICCFTPPLHSIPAHLSTRGSNETQDLGNMARGWGGWKKFFYEIGPYAAFHLSCDLAADTGSHYFPCPQQRDGRPHDWVKFSVWDWRERWVGKGSQTQSTGSAKESSCSQTKELDRGCMWERGLMISASLFNLLSLIRSFPLSAFISCLQLWQIIFSCWDSSPHVSTFLASPACSHLFCILLPCHSQDRIWS